MRARPVRIALKLLSFALLLGLTALAVVGQVRGAGAARARLELYALERELVDLKVVAADLEVYRNDLSRVRALGEVWPVRADGQLLMRLRSALPGAHVDVESDSGDSALVRVQCSGGPEQIAPFVAALQSTRLRVTAASAEHGTVKVVASVADSVRMLEAVRSKVRPAQRRRAESVLAFDPFGSESRRIEATRREVAAEIARLDALVGPLAGVPLAKSERNDRLTVMDAIERSALMPLTAAQLEDFIGAPTRFTSLRISFSPLEAVFEGALAPGITEGALVAETSLSVVQRAPGRWAVRPSQQASARR